MIYTHIHTYSYCYYYYYYYYYYYCIVKGGIRISFASKSVKFRRRFANLPHFGHHAKNTGCSFAFHS